MISYRLVETLEELQRLMPLFLEGFRAMNKRQKAFECDETGFIKTLVRVLGMREEDGGILVAEVDGSVVGYGVAFDGTPIYCEERILLLWGLYVKPEWSKLVTKPMFEHMEGLAEERGFVTLRAFNGRLNGSSINFFERVLGMRRHKIEFTKQIYGRRI